MISTSHYWLKKIEAGVFRVLSFEVNVCPICGHAVLVIGVRKRKYINEAEEKQTLIIRRLRCKGCWAIHHELPDILIPYKRHCADTVEKVIKGDVRDVCCEVRTISRIKQWWTTCKPYFESVLASLREKYDIEFSQYPAPREIVRAVVNANLWIHTRSACLAR